MENNKCFELILINIAVLALLCFTSSFSKQTVKILELHENTVCKKGKGSAPDYVCKRFEICETVKKYKSNQTYPDICSFNGSQTIICCPPKNEKVKKVIIANEKCNQYSELANKYSKKPKINSAIMKRNVNGVMRPFVVGGKEAAPAEFPHMVLLGYGETIDDVQWGCGGSLISERWILTAAHCTRVGSPNVTRWARVGDLNTETNTDNAQPKNYRVALLVVHPDYKPPSLYNDIALFRLENDVEFTAYARPICLNTNSSLTPNVVIATGWGSTSTAGPTSAHLLKVDLNIIPTSQCNISYFPNMSRNLKSGILNDRMMCAGWAKGGKDTCSGDSGGPLQVKHVENPKMYTQIGITSFGKFCGDKDTPGVYTKVSKYIPWIERIVWPKE